MEILEMRFFEVEKLMKHGTVGYKTGTTKYQYFTRDEFDHSSTSSRKQHH